MKDRLKELEKKKIVQEYSYTKTELEYKKTVIDENTKDFLNVAYTIAGKERQVSEEKNIQENENREKKIEESKIDESKIDSYIIKKSKKLYREISKRTHPDKDTQGLYTKIFIDATKSYEEFKIRSQNCSILLFAIKNGFCCKSSSKVIWGNVPDLPSADCCNSVMKDSSVKNW